MENIITHIIIYMSYFSWKNVSNFYKYHSKNNEDFLHKLSSIPLTSYSSDIIEVKNTISNTDLVESTNPEQELTELYKQNALVTTRMGCVESLFILTHLGMSIPSHLKQGYEIDYYMKRNAGFYYKDSIRQKELRDWWINETIELIRFGTITSCYVFLGYDLILWSALNIKKKYYNYDYLTKVILQNSDGKKLLYIGNGVESIKTGYERGVQKAWSFRVSSFSMYYVKTPQTTLGCDYPDESIKETCETLIEEINNHYADFDTAILGCGAYGPPLINKMRKNYPNKNIVYLGSDCYKMFGIYSNAMPFHMRCNAVTENWIEVVEDKPMGTENHPEPKYWK